MSQVVQPLRRFASFCSTRRGTMLIMVIVILVLLALIGTAMISTSRVDRLSTQQHSFNTQIDLLVQSVENMATSAISSDLYGTDATTGATSFRSGTGYYDYDALGDSAASAPATPGADNYLASRHPTVSGNVQWPWVTQWMQGASYESPYLENTTSHSTIYSIRHNMQIVPAGLPLTSGGVTTTFPAVYNDSGQPQLAGDADGDGIPDSGLFKIPIGALNGVTYYAAVRILDNNSALNATSALSSTTDYTKSDGTVTTQNYGFFASELGLKELMATSDNLTNYNNWRFNYPAAAIDTTSALPVSDANATVGDFLYASVGDMITNQIARRPNNPGYVATGTRFQSLPLTDSLALAYRFCLQNPAASPSVLESPTTGLPNSLLHNYGATPYNAAIKTAPYAATDVANWYTNNFTGVMPMRTMLVARNAVQGIAPTHNLLTLPNSYLTPYLPSNIAVVTQPNLIPFPGATVAAATNPQYLPKVSVNTAPFNMLWRGFWNVMAGADAFDIPQTDFADIAANGNAHMFNTSVRDPNVGAPTADSAFQQMMLRSAIAAINALDLRNAGRLGSTSNKQEFIASSRQVPIYNQANALQAIATVYGCEPQPYITEVYADGDTKGALNPGGYVAIELYNPYPFDISMKNWQLASSDRISATNATLVLNPITAFSGMVDPTTGQPAVVKAGSYLVLENFAVSGVLTGVADAKQRPAAAKATLDSIAAPAAVCYVPNLGELLWNPTTNAAREFELLKPRRMLLDNTAVPAKLECDAVSTGTFPGTGTAYAEIAPSATPLTQAQLSDFIPADQFDFTGFPAPTGDTSYYELHYVRENGDGHKWKFVFPGLYDPKGAQATNGFTVGYRQQGVTPIFIAAAAADPWDPAAGTPPAQPIQLGLVDTASSYPNNAATPPVQIVNVDFGGPNPQTTAVSPIPKNKFPYGGFARNGDMLEIPYIGSYRLQSATNVLTEMNALTTDCGYAHAGNATSRFDPTNDAYENLGHFCPMAGMYSATNSKAMYVVTAGTPDYYDWTSKLFTYFGVWTPSDDYFPNVDPGMVDNAAVATPTASGTYRYPAGNGSTIPYAVANAGTTASDTRVPVAPAVSTAGSEDLLPMEGLININTAPARVLGAIPWVPKDPTTNAAMDQLAFDPATGKMTKASNGVADNIDIGMMIAAWRDNTNGVFPNATYPAAGQPFKSITDLNNIVATNSTMAAPVTFSNCFGLLPPTGALTWQLFGDITPATGTDDGVAGDAEKNFLMLNRVSNFITTRSDTFTVYVLVQGWQNVGTTTPQLVVQRRAAIIVDRTALSPTNTSVTTTNIPTD